MVAAWRPSSASAFLKRTGRAAIRSSLRQRGRHLGQPRPACPAGGRQRLQRPGAIPTPNTRTDRAMRPSRAGHRYSSARTGEYPAAAAGISPPPEELAYPIIITDVTERASRLVGQWPTAESLAGQIAKAFTEAAEREPDSARRAGYIRLRQFSATLPAASWSKFSRGLSSARRASAEDRAAWWTRCR